MTSSGEYDGFAEEIQSPMQREFDGILVPLVLSCAKKGATIEEYAKWVTKHQALLEQKLARHGAILFRGFPTKDAATFNTFIEAFQGDRWQNLSYERSLSFAVRTPVLGRVCTTNDGRNGGLTFHHEQAQTPLYPSKLMFFCEIAAKEGGATGISPSTMVLKALEKKYPQFIKDCEEKGVTYTALLRAEPDPENGVGRGWKSFFARNSVEEAEKRMKELGYTWEWMDDDHDWLKATSPVLKAVRTVRILFVRVCCVCVCV